MGRQPNTSNRTEEPVPEGALTPEAWVKVVLAQYLGAATGTLVIQNGDDNRTYRFIGGTPTMVRSTLANEDFTETMVGAGIIEQARLDWIRKHTRAEESEIEALIGAGTIDRAKVDAHHAVHIQYLLGAGLAWAEGTYTWDAKPEIRERFESSLLPSANVVEGLIGGVFGSFDLGALRTYVDAANAGEFLPDPKLTSEEHSAWLPADMRGINQVLGQNHSRQEMASLIGCDADRLAALLWILEAAGWVKRHAPPAALIPLGTVATIQSGQPSAAPEAVSAPPMAAAPKAVPPPVAPAPTPKPEPAVQTAKPKPAAKTAPAKKATQRPAPSPKTPVVDSMSLLKTAMTSLESGDFDGAYPLLIDARKQRPSCPDTLAALGWTAWRTGNLGTNAYDGPEDFLLLALTFDAKHPKALEYYARIAIDKGETENARNRLLQVLQVTPDASWAQEALEASGTARKGGMRLWPKSNQ